MTRREIRSVHHCDAIRTNTVGVDNGKRLMKVTLAQSSRFGQHKKALPKLSHESQGSDCNKGTPKAMVLIPSSEFRRPKHHLHSDRTLGFHIQKGTECGCRIPPSFHSPSFQSNPMACRPPHEFVFGLKIPIY